MEEGEGEEEGWGRPVEPPGWIVRTPSRTTPRRRVGLSEYLFLFTLIMKRKWTRN